MKSRDTLVRLKRFQVDEKRRRIVQLNAMIAEFTRMANDLDREISAEEKRVNIADPNHYAYPTYARAARTRRDNMVASVNELRGQLEEAEARYEEAKEEFEKAQNQEARDRSVERMVDIVAERHAAADLPEPVRRA
jgi:flagellar FliJ protein